MSSKSSVYLFRSEERSKDIRNNLVSVLGVKFVGNGEGEIAVSQPTDHFSLSQIGTISLSIGLSKARFLDIRRSGLFDVLTNVGVVYTDDLEQAG